MIRRICASHFRSLGKDVTLDLGDLTVLVGQNGAGKSNMIDALVFLADCMQIGLEGAITKRGGIQTIRHAGTQGRPFDVVLRVEVCRDDVEADYEIILTGDSIEQYRVKRERGKVRRKNTSNEFVVEAGTWLHGPLDLQPRVDASSLALPLLAGDRRFNPLAEILRSVTSYSVFPDELRRLHKYDPKRPMDRHGTNWVSILKDQEMDSWKPDLVTVLRKLTGDIVDMKFEHAAGFLFMQFRHEQDAKAKRKQWFEAGQESDGTLRVAGILTALLQQPRPALIAIEEPELTVHPGALRLLCDYIREGSSAGQVLLTTHSPDLLTLLNASEVRVVQRVDNKTTVAPLEESQREVVTRGLFSLGEIMRSEGLRPAQLSLPLEEDAT
ncbi:MAG: AAA family ATPase [Polyangiaceae bacterium]|nr:AAA family ATPase [Polyangiaceae bacterium]